MRRIAWLPAFGFGAFLAFGSAHKASSATLLWKNYNNPESRTMRLLNQQHLDGMLDAIVSYNVFLKQSNENTLFCLPTDSLLTVEQADEILGSVANRLKNPDNVPISVLLIVGLQERFPCS